MQVVAYLLFYLAVCLYIFLPYLDTNSFVCVYLRTLCKTKSEGFVFVCIFHLNS
jgi:hypothetical protein